MKKFHFYFLCLSLICSFCSLSAQQEGFLFGDSGEDKQIMVQNRILAHVMDKPISVMDVMKKMDILFYKQFPEYTSSRLARFQFYQINWKYVLNDLVDKELILADAKESQLPISNGDVRQEMETLFGPNIIANLDKIGLSFDEAWDIIKGDITIRRMLYVRVHPLVLRKVTPQVIKNAYEDYSKTHIRPEKWTYQVLSFRHKDAEKASKAAHVAHHLLTENQISTTELSTWLKTNPDVDTDVTLNVSEEFVHTSKDISPSYLEVLKTLPAATYSTPITQKSRAAQSTLFRIFYLKEKEEGGIIPFKQVEQELKDKLTDEATAKETDVYLGRLRKHFRVNADHIQKMIPEDFQPFALY